MRFGCRCGNIIRDTSDFLSYKADFFASQDEEDLYDGIEKTIKNESISRKECVDLILFQYVSHYISRSMYQCPKCGRIYIEDNAGKFHCFTPEPDEEADKNLLISVEGKAWKGILIAEWRDEKAEYLDNGYIQLKVNKEHEEFQEFDDKEAFLKRYYELFEELKSEKLLRMAQLYENGVRIHSYKGQES